MRHAASRIPVWLKTLYTLLACITLAVNIVSYGPADLLWFSDVALILTAPALWLESPLLTSMMALDVVLIDTGWAIVFLCRLVTGLRLGGMAEYMFDRRIPLGVRAASLFHLFLPALILWMIYRLRYDRRALPAQTILGWAVLVATFGLTRAQKNINWVFGPGMFQHFMPRPLYLLVMMALVPIVVYLPTHWALERIFGVSRGASKP